MKALEFEIEVTAEAIDRAQPDMREALRIARHEYFARRWYVRYVRLVGFGATALGLLISVTLMFDSLWWSWYAAFCVAAALLLGVNTERLTQRINNWTLRYSLRRLRNAAPYVARYRLDEQSITTRIDKFNLERRRPWTYISKVFLGDHAVVLLTRGYPSRQVFIVPATLEQFKQLETHLRACKLEVVSLPPKFVPQSQLALSSDDGCQT